MKFLITRLIIIKSLQPKLDDDTNDVLMDDCDELPPVIFNSPQIGSFQPTSPHTRANITIEPDVHVPSTAEPDVKYSRCGKCLLTYYV